VADADPLNVASANRVGERVEGITDQPEDMLDPELSERADQNIRYRLCHL
jgi:hypothetical protein